LRHGLPVVPVIVRDIDLACITGVDLEGDLCLRNALLPRDRHHNVIR
jgi:hypothetical protein